MTTVPGSPVDRLLSTSLIVAPLLYLLADTLYALNGWDDATAGVVHVLAAAAYAFVLLRVVTWGGADGLALAALLVGVAGLAGNVGYGFNTIHASLGDTDLNDATGAATLIKPLGLCFPLSLLLMALILHRVGAGVAAGLLLVAGLLWPVAHIANIAALAVLVNVLLVGALGSLRVPTAVVAGPPVPQR